MGTYINSTGFKVRAATKRYQRHFILSFDIGIKEDLIEKDRCRYSLIMVSTLPHLQVV
jgi:hypothetical protein